MLQLEHITFSCDDPARLAEFWGQLLGLRDCRGGHQLARHRSAREGTRLLFNRMPKSPTIELPIHLDVNVPDREAELARVLELGGQSRRDEDRTGWATSRRHGRSCATRKGTASASRRWTECPAARHIGNVTFRLRGAAGARAVLGERSRLARRGDRRRLSAAVPRRGCGRAPAHGLPRHAAAGRRRPRFLFQRREKSRPESHPIHLDFGTDDREAEIERLTSAGASVVETKVGTNITFTVMRDPEGNPFCVGRCLPTRRYLPGRDNAVVQKYVLSELDSGERVISERIPSVRSVAIGFWIGAGSRDETDAKAGVSHFIEHLLFKGSRAYTAQQIAEIFDGLGGELNAATSREHTMVYARVPDAHVQTALNVMTDMVFAPGFTDLDSERDVVLEEIAMYEDTPQELVHDLFSRGGLRTPSRSGAR